MFSLKIKIKYNILLNIQDHVFVFVCGNVNVYETKKYLERTIHTLLGEMHLSMQLKYYFIII